MKRYEEIICIVPFTQTEHAGRNLHVLWNIFSTAVWAMLVTVKWFLHAATVRPRLHSQQADSDGAAH